MKMMLQKITDRWDKLTTKQKKTCIAVLVVLVVGIFFLLKKDTKVTDLQEDQNAVPVVVTKITERTFERYLTVQGNLESKNFTIVSPRVAGTIEEFYVDEGDTVVANQTKLFKTDSIKLQETVEVRKHLLSVEECVRREAIANLEKTEADFYKAELDYHRFERLLEKKVVSVDAFERQQSRYKQLAAVVKLAKANVDLTTANVQKVKANLAISKKDLADTVIYAPITGKISYRFKESGEMGQPGEPVVRIDDTSLIETSAYLPAQYYTEVIPQKTMVEVIVSGKNIGQFPVSYKSPTINPKLRTFEVKCLLDNPSETIAPGAMAQIRVILETKQGLAVPSTAIQQRGGKSIVFTIREDKAEKIEVQREIENHGWTEVVSDKLNEQSLVVTMGQDMLDDGQLVSVQKEGN
jgi:RND family efflux transporter MFP subunit